jgi:hypothetical protein
MQPGKQRRGRREAVEVKEVEELKAAKEITVFDRQTVGFAP